MAIEQSADDAAIDHAGKSLLIRLRLKFGHNVAASIFSRVAFDMQPFVVLHAAAETDTAGRVFFLE